ncbi:hypothetical protein [Streptomyces sp. AM8-1-1]|uniref:hypothetical protein n=1 Tax=Streptomyces sp. AM8-1-1 TaxID=3075825 RepID=UPI0028C3C7FD|nr:hypothetical protein [Streptomyces sp. AM8-1-1]WNO76832.1 hypothetical protein RPQ07_36705 [Streptomyces sp. AM8-1-1]
MSLDEPGARGIWTGRGARSKPAPGGLPRCDFYTPRNSSKGLLLEAKENFQKVLASMPLTDDERAAVRRPGRPPSINFPNGEPMSQLFRD